MGWKKRGLLVFSVLLLVLSASGVTANMAQIWCDGKLFTFNSPTTFNDWVPQRKADGHYSSCGKAAGYSYGKSLYALLKINPSSPEKFGYPISIDAAAKDQNTLLGIEGGESGYVQDDIYAKLLGRCKITGSNTLPFKPLWHQNRYKITADTCIGTYSKWECDALRELLLGKGWISQGTQVTYDEKMSCGAAGEAVARTLNENTPDDLRWVSPDSKWSSPDSAYPDPQGPAGADSSSSGKPGANNYNLVRDQDNSDFLDICLKNGPPQLTMNNQPVANNKLTPGTTYTLNLMGATTIADDIEQDHAGIGGAERAFLRCYEHGKYYPDENNAPSPVPRPFKELALQGDMADALHDGFTSITFTINDAAVDRQKKIDCWVYVDYPKPVDGRDSPTESVCTHWPRVRTFIGTYTVEPSVCKYQGQTYHAQDTLPGIPEVKCLNGKWQVCGASTLFNPALDGATEESYYSGNNQCTMVTSTAFCDPTVADPAQRWSATGCASGQCFDPDGSLVNNATDALHSNPNERRLLCLNSKWYACGTPDPGTTWDFAVNPSGGAGTCSQLPITTAPTNWKCDSRSTNNGKFWYETDAATSKDNDYNPTTCKLKQCDTNICPSGQNSPSCCTLNPTNQKCQYDATGTDSSVSAFCPGSGSQCVNYQCTGGSTTTPAGNGEFSVCDPSPAAVAANPNQCASGLTCCPEGRCRLDGKCGATPLSCTPPQPTAAEQSFPGLELVSEVPTDYASPAYCCALNDPGYGLGSGNYYSATACGACATKECDTSSVCGLYSNSPVCLCKNFATGSTLENDPQLFNCNPADAAFSGFLSSEDPASGSSPLCELDANIRTSSTPQKLSCGDVTPSLCSPSQKLNNGLCCDAKLSSVEEGSGTEIVYRPADWIGGAWDPSTPQVTNPVQNVRCCMNGEMINSFGASVLGNDAQNLAVCNNGQIALCVDDTTNADQLSAGLASAGFQGIQIVTTDPTSNQNIIYKGDGSNEAWLCVPDTTLDAVDPMYIPLGKFIKVDNAEELISKDWLNQEEGICQKSECYVSQAALDTIQEKPTAVQDAPQTGCIKAGAFIEDHVCMVDHPGDKAYWKTRTEVVAQLLWDNAQSANATLYCDEPAKALQYLNYNVPNGDLAESYFSHTCNNYRCTNSVCVLKDGANVIIATSINYELAKEQFLKLPAAFSDKDTTIDPNACDGVRLGFCNDRQLFFDNTSKLMLYKKGGALDLRTVAPFNGRWESSTEAGNFRFSSFSDGSTQLMPLFDTLKISSPNTFGIFLAKNSQVTVMGFRGNVHDSRGLRDYTFIHYKPLNPSGDLTVFCEDPFFKDSNGNSLCFTKSGDKGAYVATISKASTFWPTAATAAKLS
ncbi:hypothetical protein HZB02_01205 [Candidatus Woesearchaeota archaeon]|nr:hypothetical protein [Candidatus Woesearchaeota archaeon]